MIGESLPSITQAERWASETQSLALVTEIGALDQELLSQPMRVELLKARQELAAHNVRWVRSRVQLLKEAVTQRRQADLASVQDETEAARIEFAGKHPLLEQLAEENASLGTELASTAKQLERVNIHEKDIDELTAQIEQEFKNAREALEIAGLSQALGQVLLEQRRSLPDPRAFRRQLEKREATIAEFGLRRINNKEEYRKLRDLDSYAGQLLSGGEPQDAGRIRVEMQALLEKRRELTGKLLELEETTLRELGMAA